jgi:hypothetical protein
VRSEMVFAAEQKLANRYILCRVLATATRKFHQPNARIEETTNAVLQHIANVGEQQRNLSPEGRAGGASKLSLFERESYECYATTCA